MTSVLLLMLGLAHAFDPAGATDTDAFGVVDLEDAPIINGAPARKDDFPMTGGMLLGGTIQIYGFEIEGKLLMCSSTLIAPDVVLLAAHCVDIETMLAASGMGGVEIVDQQFAWSPKPDLSTYQLTQATITDPPDWPADVAFASEVFAHPKFDIQTLGMGLTRNYDIALMFLEEPVFDVPYAILPTPEEDAQLRVGMEVDIVGWGQQTADPYGPVGTKQWGTSYIAEEAPYELKVGDVVGDVRKCHGDSGGPSFAYVETDSAEDMRLIGVTSHAYDLTDCDLTGGVDTRVGFYLDWIDEQMRKRCEGGTRSWCEWPGIIPPPDADGLMAWEQALVIDDEDEARKACGCVVGGPGGGWWLVALGAVLARRRSASKQVGRARS